MIDNGRTERGVQRCDRDRRRHPVMGLSITTAEVDRVVGDAMIATQRAAWRYEQGNARIAQIARVLDGMGATLVSETETYLARLS